MRLLRSFIEHRAHAVGVAALVGLGVHLAKPSPPPRTLDGLAEMLGRASGKVVDPKDIVWEKSPGFLEESFLGRWVLFLAAAEPGKPRDLYRARVRVTLGGQPINVRLIRNLTDTPLGDDTTLEVRDRTAVFATVAFGRIQGIGVIELDGIRDEDRPGSVFDRMLLAINEFQHTGTFSGLGRTNVVLDVPAREARLTLAPPDLRIDLGEQGRELVYSLSDRSLHGEGGAQAYAARAVPLIHGPKPFVIWAVDTVRDEVGNEPITWLENKVFGAKDAVKRTTYTLFSSSAERALKQVGDRPTVAAVLEASQLKDSDNSWPPPSVPSIWKEPKPGEGEWKPVEIPFLKALPGVPKSAAKPPPYFYQTTIRPDPKRPYSEVLLIAMDMRQLELGMQAGFEDPKPLTGPPGDGRLPRDPDVLDRIVATFNGAFKTTHGAYGMMVDRRVLVPAVPRAATVMVTEEHDVGLGSWPASDKPPEEVVAFRQNLDPLVEDGVTNPTGRYIWGWQLNGTSVMTQRTALCVTPAGHLYYAFAPEIDGPTLGNALRQAGCSYGVHLDMNPGHCGFMFTDIADFKKKEFNLQKAHPEMKTNPDRFVRWSAKDFFYVMLRNPVPRDPSGVVWAPDAGAQPPPAFMPGVFAGKLVIGAGLQVELSSFERGSVAWRIRAGTKEPSIVGAPPKKLEIDGDDAGKVIAAIGVGHSTDATRLGLAFGVDPALPPKKDYATVVLGAPEPPRIERPGSLPKLTADQEAFQLPLLADDGELLPYAREPGAMRMRGAMCVTPGGRVVIARARHDSSDPIASALLRVGCKRVVELDRGSHHPAFVHRAGTETPPVRGYETSVLYAIGRPLLPHAFRWQADGVKASKKPTLFDYRTGAQVPRDQGVKGVEGQ